MQIPIRMLTATQRRKRLQPLISEVFIRHGILPSWGLAFAFVESNFRPWIVVSTGGDGKRGGAWGLFQMTFMTARALGFRGMANELLDERLNAALAAKLIAQHKSNYGDLGNVASRYNSGKPLALAPESTRGYVKKIEFQQNYYVGLGTDEKT